MFYFVGNLPCFPLDEARKLLLETTFLPNCFSMFTRVSPAILPPLAAALLLSVNPCASALRASSAVVVSPSMVSANSNGVMWSLRLWLLASPLVSLWSFVLIPKVPFEIVSVSIAYSSPSATPLCCHGCNSKCWFKA